MDEFLDLISTTGIVNYLRNRGSRSTYDTVAAYILYLQEAYLIHKSERYNIAGKELLAGNFKAYVNDQAYHNYLFPTARFGSRYILEGIVYMELLRRGYNVATGVLRDKEVDFIATGDRHTLYVQVAYMLTDESTDEREYSSLESVSGTGEKLLVTLDDFQFPTRSGVRHVQAWRLAEVLDGIA